MFETPFARPSNVMNKTQITQSSSRFFFANSYPIIYYLRNDLRIFDIYEKIWCNVEQQPFYWVSKILYDLGPYRAITNCRGLESMQIYDDTFLLLKCRRQPKFHRRDIQAFDIITFTPLRYYSFVMRHKTIESSSTKVIGKVTRFGFRNAKQWQLP